MVFADRVNVIDGQFAEHPFARGPSQTGILRSERRVVANVDLPVTVIIGNFARHAAGLPNDLARPDAAAPNDVTRCPNARTVIRDIKIGELFRSLPTQDHLDRVSRNARDRFVERRARALAAAPDLETVLRL